MWIWADRDQLKSLYLMIENLYNFILQRLSRLHYTLNVTDVYFAEANENNSKGKINSQRVVMGKLSRTIQKEKFAASCYGKAFENNPQGKIRIEV
jgi:hypothetical protein